VSFVFDIHPDVSLDITEIANYLNLNHEGLGDDFIIAVDDSIDRLENELNKGVFKGRKSGDIFAQPIFAEKNSPSYAKKFLKYYLWYEVVEQSNSVYIYTIIYSGRKLDSILSLIEKRRD